MKVKMFASAAALAVVLVLGNSAVFACPGCGKKKDAKVVKAADKDVKTAKKAGCGGCKSKGAKSAKVVTTGDKSGKTAKKGCCGHRGAKNAALTADGKTDGKKKCRFGSKLAADKDGGCPIGKRIDATLASLPKMTYKIGDNSTGCSHSAAAMAKESGKPLQYVVGESTFDKEGEAIVKLASLLENELKTMETVQYTVGEKCMQCPMTAKKVAKASKKKMAYRVAGFDFASKDQAEKALELAKAAADEVKMTYKVGDASFCCDKMAGAKVKESGKKMTYLVGDEETGCPKHASVLLNELKIRKAVEAAGSAFASAV